MTSVCKMLLKWGKTAFCQLRQMSVLLFCLMEVTGQLIELTSANRKSIGKQWIMQS